jgi:hypothetical protein
MQSIWPFLLDLARTNGLAFLAALGVFVLFCAPLIWLARRAERRYLLQSGAEIPESGIPSTSGRMAKTEGETPQDAARPPQEEGGQDGVTRLSARQSTQ